MRIWLLLLIKSDLKWCIYISRTLFYITQLQHFISDSLDAFPLEFSMETTTTATLSTSTMAMTTPAPPMNRNFEPPPPIIPMFPDLGEPLI